MVNFLAIPILEFNNNRFESADKFPTNVLLGDTLQDRKEAAMYGVLSNCFYNQNVHSIYVINNLLQLKW